METELVRLYEAAREAANDAIERGGPAEASCIVALNRLKTFPVSYQLLLSTQVGKHLRGLTKHNNNKIKVLAAEVVNLWKDVIVKETSKNKNNGGKKNEDSGFVEKVRSVKIEKPPALRSEGNNLMGRSKSRNVMFSESDKKVLNVDAVKTKRNPSAEKIKVERMIKEEKSSSEVIKPKQKIVDPPKLNSIVYCQDALRDKIREILADALCRVSFEVTEDLIDEVSTCDPYQVAVLMETAMFEKWGKSNGPLKAKYRSIMFNIKDSNNPDFRRKVLLGEFAPHSITKLTSDQMASEARQARNEEIKRKALFECEHGTKQEATTDKFCCSRCGKWETTYFQMQTRSADEPMTTYITCVNCGNHMKEY